MRDTSELIHLTVHFDNETYSLTSYSREYRSLMALLFDKLNIDDFGQCKGMGRCSTCLVALKRSHPVTDTRNRNEEATLAKAGIHDPAVRLSCQVFVDESLDGAIVTILPA